MTEPPPDPGLLPYFYAQQDGCWVVKGPAATIYGETVLEVPWLDKNVACIIALLLSGNASESEAARQSLFRGAAGLLESLIAEAKG